MNELGPVENLTYRSVAADAIGKHPQGCTFAGLASDESLAGSRALPSFFIVGPPRTGSSWLYEILSKRVILPTPSKETRFFDNHFERGLKWYLAHYKESAEERKMGEVAPTYFASAQARERLCRMVPDARIICIFRNPAERIISLYRLKRAYGLIACGFEEALQRDPELLDTSRYASNLKLWQRSFGEHNVLPCLYDDLRERPQMFVDDLADFIGIPRFTLQGPELGLVHGSERMTQPRNFSRTRKALLVADWFKSRRLDGVVSAFKRSALCKLVLGGGEPFPPVPVNVVQQLYEKVYAEVEDLEALLQRDLSSWKSPQNTASGEIAPPYETPAA